MADPVISKTGAAIAQTVPKEALGQPGKQGPSNFDRVQDTVAGQQQAAPRLPPPVEQVTPAQRKDLVSEVRRKMEADPAGHPKVVFGPELGDMGANLERVRRRVDSVPSVSAEIKSRLSQIESQFQQTSVSLDKLPNMTDPRSLLQMQVQMYTMTQNIEIVSKAVEQLNSGVKTVLQTQV